MAVIKHAERDRLTRQAMVLDLGDLRRAAEAMEQRAVAEAERIVREARAERERIIAGAREEGFETGKAEGTAAGLTEGRDQGRAEALARHGEEAARILAAWERALNDFEGRRGDLLLDARSRILALAAAIAERVIKRSIAIDPTVVADQVAAALGAVVSPSRLALRINPEDDAVVQAMMPSLRRRLGESTHVSIECDAALSRGSVIVRTDGGEVDATVESQLDRIVRVVLPGGGDGPVEASAPDAEGA